MPDFTVNQVRDRHTVGIPALVEEASWQASQSADAAAASEEAAALSESEAARHASDAQAAADEAEAWATSEPTVFISDTEPPDPNPGTVWFRTGASSTVIEAIRRFEADAAGDGLFPSDATYPGSDTYPNPMGDWSDYTLAQALVTS